MAVAPAANALTTVANVKYVLGIVQTDLTKDDRIQTLVNLLSGRIEDWCGRKFTSQDYTAEKYDGDHEDTLYLKQYPITAVAAVSIDDIAMSAAELVDPLYFQVYSEEGYLWCSRGFAARRQGVLVTYTAGYATIPTGLQMACIEWAIILFEGRMKDAKVKQEDTKLAMPDQVMQALQPYKRIDG